MRSVLPRHTRRAATIPRLPVSQLAPGQVVAAAVSSASGVVLIQPGTELTEALITRLVALGVEHVSVAGAALSPEERQTRLAEVDARFVGHERNAWMMALKAIVVRQVAGDEAGPRG